MLLMKASLGVGGVKETDRKFPLLPTLFTYETPTDLKSKHEEP